MKLTRIKAGEKFVVREGAYNAFCDAAEANAANFGAAGRGGTAAGGNGPALIVKIINDTGFQLDAGFPCWLDELESPAPLDQTRYDANARPMLRAVFRTGYATTRMNQLFGVCVEPIPAGDIGRVCIRGICAAYVKESSSLVGEDAGRYAIPVQTLSGLEADLCVFRRSMTEGPVEILQLLGDEAAIGGTVARLYLVSVDQKPAVVRAMRDPTHGYVPLYQVNLDNLSRFSNLNAGSGQYPNVFDGFYRSFTITDAPLTALSGTGALANKGLIENSIVRVPCRGMYDISFTALCLLEISGTSTGISSIQVGDSLSISELAYAVKLVTVNDAGDEVTAVQYPAWPGQSTDIDFFNNAGADIARLPIIRRTGSASSLMTLANSRGSFSGSCRLHLYDHLRVGIRILCRSAGGLTDPEYGTLNIKVSGTLEVKPSPPELHLTPGKTAIVGTPGTSAAHDYTLASTGTLPMPGVTIASYAWRVACPDGEFETGTGSSLAHDYADHGDGEYVARLIATYTGTEWTGGSTLGKGATEFRFTLPNP